MSDQKMNGTVVHYAICIGNRIPDRMMWGPLQDMQIHAQLSVKVIVVE